MTEAALSQFGRFDSLGSDGKPAKLGLMGGTFDPIHLGHLRMAEEMREALGLDGVLFIPAGHPVFKRGQALTSGEDRLAMVADAVASNPHFDVSAVEIERPGDTYTVDTLRWLKNTLGDSVELYLLMGDDVALSFPHWKEAEAVATMATLAIACGRPEATSEAETPWILEESLDRNLQSSLKALGVDAVYVPVSPLAISSTDLRKRKARGQSLRYLVPSAVPAFGEYHEFEEPIAASEALAKESSNPTLTKEFFKHRKKELEGRVDERRFSHSLNVSKTAVELAKIYGVDQAKARIAGLLHDWDKGYDDAGIRQRVRELGLTDRLSPYVVESMPRVLHSHTAAHGLGQEFPELPKDVLQAIDRHTVGAKDMTPLDMVIYIADALEPGRKGDDVAALRQEIGEVSLEQLFLDVYEHWTVGLLSKRRTLHPDTIAIWNTYATKQHPPKGY